MDDINLRNYAYLGDAIWELFVRKHTIFATNNSKKLHKITTELVNTNFQCELLHYLEEYLTAEEEDIARRARNLPIPIGRRAIQTQYRQATAFETLIGIWHSTNQQRFDEIIKILEPKILEKL